MANKITTLLEFKEQGGGLKKISADVKAADGATGKFKAGWQGAMTTVKAYGAEAALAVGTTLAVAAVKAGQEFANAAIEAGRFADATGVSTEEASKWISVADDLGLNADDVQKAFLRLNKEIGEGDGVAEEYGLTLKRTADGAADVNGTMLETIKVVNGIKDPTERARVAQELFGRSYANVAELIFDDADKVAAALESTSEAQIFDEDEVNKAREYRAAMDRFNDVLVDLKYTIGEGVVPVLTDAADAAVDFKEAVEAIPGVPSAVEKWWNNASPLAWIRHVGNAWTFVGEQVGLVDDEVKAYDESLALTAEETERSVAILNGQTAALEDNAEHLRASAREATYNADAQEEMGEIQAAVTKVVDKAREAQEKFLDSIKHTRDEVGKLKREIDDQQAWISMLDAFDRTEETLANADTTTREAYSSVLELKEAVIEYGEETLNLPDKVITDLIAQIDAGKAAEVEAFLERLQNGVTLPIRPEVRGSFNTSSRSRGGPTLTAEGNLIPNVRGATGGIVTQPTMALIGEAGPEAVVPLDRTPGSSPLPSGMGGGVTINMTVNSLAANGDELGREVVRAIEREMRWRGPVSGWG